VRRSMVRWVSAFRTPWGGNSIAFGDNDTGIKQNGDGILDVYANGQHVFRFQNGVAGNDSNLLIVFYVQIMPD
ncbi:hypothetical protein CUA67_24815, partial [Shigella dysenteriae]